MPNELKSFSEIFNERIFRITDYQRGYAWGTDQLVDFWEDLINLPQGKNHYTGLLSIKKADTTSSEYDEDRWLINKGYKLYHIVDGQQRLTTFSIFVHEILMFISQLHSGKTEDEIYFCDSSLKEIREKYVSRKRPPNLIITTFLFGYEVGNPSSKFLIHKIYDEPNGGTVEESFYTKNLANAKKFFRENIKALYDKYGLEEVEILFHKLTQQLMFNIHDIDSDYDVYVAFETMNNRGKRLTNLELLKNRLIYLTTLFDKDCLDDDDRERIRKDINEAWKEIYYQLGRNVEPLSDDEFLRAHWITYFHYSRKRGDDYIHFLLRRFSAKNVFSEHSVSTEEEHDTPLSDEEADYTIDYFTEEQEDIPATVVTPMEIDRYVKNLQHFAEYWYYSWFPYDKGYLATEDEKTYIDRLNRIGIGYFRPLVVAAMSLKDSTTSLERCNLYKAIERFIFVFFRLAGYQANYLSSDYYNKSRQLLRGELQIATITESLNLLVDDDKTAIDSFVARVKKMFNSGGGFYSWWGLRYFFFEYEAMLTGKRGLQRDGIMTSWRLFTTSEKDKVSIEHILPQTPTEWYWENQFRDYTEEEINILSGSLGNLLPLSQSINSSLQNDSFEEKKNPKNKKRRGYVNGSHSEIEVANKRDWTAQCIYDRGMRLLEFISERWSIQITDEQKRNLLNIEFVNDGRQPRPELLRTSPKDYALYLSECLKSHYNFPWVERHEDKVLCTTPGVDAIKSNSSQYPWDGGRLVIYEFECGAPSGVCVTCKISTRADRECEEIFNKSIAHSDFTNVTYGKNGTPKPTKRRRRVIVFSRELFPADEMSKGLQETMNNFSQALDSLLNGDIRNFENIILS